MDASTQELGVLILLMALLFVGCPVARSVHRAADALNRIAEQMEVQSGE